MAVSSWSTTPASNNAAPPNGAPEGMTPGSVNDTIRQIMADVRTFYDNAARLDTANSFVTNTNASFLQVIQNTSVGNAGVSELALVNNVNALRFRYTSTGYAGPFLTGGPSGEHGMMYTTGATPISIGTTSTERIRIAGDGSVINLQSTAVQVNGVDITASTSTFTATLASGLTTTPTGTLSYKKIGNVVTLYNNTGSTISGTSNSGSFSITGLPAAIQPSTARFLPTHWLDNGSTVTGGCSISAAGTITASISSGAFTSSGTKGIPSGWSVTFPV
jgi:hypothetical protein